LGGALVSIVACGNDEQLEQSARVQLPEANADLLGIPLDSHPADFTDRKGNHWVLSKVIKTFAPVPSNGDMDAVERRPGPTPEEMSRWPDERLAAYWSPILVTNGVEYTLSTSPSDFVARLKRGEFYGGRSPLEPTAIPGTEGLRPQAIIGTDDRTTVIGLPPQGENSRQMLLSSVPIGANNNSASCTGSLLGPKTAISSAHCFYDNSTSSWYPTWNWAFGVATRLISGVKQQWSAFGNYIGCYSFWIPSSFVGSNTVDNDFAAIEFGCNLTPGSVVGAHGSWTASSSQISSSTVRVTGYPGSLPASTPSNFLVPTLLTQTNAVGGALVDSSNATRILHGVDTTGGQSGSALLQPIFGGASVYLTGIHKGGYAGQNHARRFDSTVYGFLKTYTSY
jgi:V8-like Glu-specific endopeptidase